MSGDGPETARGMGAAENRGAFPPVDDVTPVNPFSLLEALNTGADTGHTAWLIFLGVMSYVLITVAGVTHKDLLLSNEIPLPILQVRIDLVRFFLFAPLLLVLFHMGVVGQLVLLARKALEFDTAVQLLETSTKRNHPLRLELHNFFFVQGIAGPDRSTIMGGFLHLMSWLTLVAFPVLILLYVQIAFLPYHDVKITAAHRIILFADIAMLALIGTFLTRPETSFRRALTHTCRSHPITMAITMVIMTGVLAFSLLFATIPGERLDRIVHPQIEDGETATAASWSFGIPLFDSKRGDGSLFGLFYRNISVPFVDFVADKDVQPGEVTLNFRGRDLRFARLDKSDLHQSDFTGAILDGASFVGSDLRGAIFRCREIEAVVMRDDPAQAGCVSAKGVVFTRARLQDAAMGGADLRGAAFEDARLDGVDLAYANMTGADFKYAVLDRAELTGGVSLVGANLLSASLQGADLTGARLFGADLTGVQAQAAILTHARLEGASLINAVLDGVDAQMARLQGADLTDASVADSDFRGAQVWQTAPPPVAGFRSADASGMTVRPTDQLDITGISAVLARLSDPKLRARLERDMKARVFQPGEADGWRRTPDGVQWVSYQPRPSDPAVNASEPAIREALTAALLKLACASRWSNGAIATGVARRALKPSFRGDITAVADRFRRSECAGAQVMAPGLLKQVMQAADAARGQ